MSHIWKWPLPIEGAAFEDQSEIVLLAQCVLGEAEGESARGKFAVACNVMNRVRDARWPDSVRHVVLQRKQYSCFNEGSPRLRVMRDPRSFVTQEVWSACAEAAVWAMFELEPDPTNGSNHYCTLKTFPKWAEGHRPVAQIGQHKFYRI